MTLLNVNTNDNTNIILLVVRVLVARQQYHRKQDGHVAGRSITCVSTHTHRHKQTCRRRNLDKSLTDMDHMTLLLC